MNIGNQIRTIRRERGMTQEALAELLNVTVSAVSQWESERTTPDLSLIPPLCRVLEISADELLGVDLARKEEEIEAISRRAGSFSAVGRNEEAKQILDDGLKQYPNSYSLMVSRMYVCGEDEEEYSVKLAQKVLEGCTDDSSRQCANQILCYYYMNKGDYPKAREIAIRSNGLWTSGEVLLAHIENTEESGTEAANLLRFGLTDILNQSICYYTGSQKRTEAEEKLAYEKSIALFELMFEDGDYGFFHGRLEDSHRKLARLSLKEGDIENALLHLEKAAGHALAFVDGVENGWPVKTSLLFRGMGCVRPSFTNEDNSAALFLDDLAAPEYDGIRETPEFAAICEKLSAAAGKWTVK